MLGDASCAADVRDFLAVQMLNEMLLTLSEGEVHTLIWPVDVGMYSDPWLKTKDPTGWMNYPIPKTLIALSKCIDAASIASCAANKPDGAILQAIAKSGHPYNITAQAVMVKVAEIEAVAATAATAASAPAPAAPAPTPPPIPAVTSRLQKLPNWLLWTVAIVGAVIGGFWAAKYSAQIWAYGPWALLILVLGLIVVSLVFMYKTQGIDTANFKASFLRFFGVTLGIVVGLGVLFLFANWHFSQGLEEGYGESPTKPQQALAAVTNPPGYVAQQPQPAEEEDPLVEALKGASNDEKMCILDGDHSDGSEYSEASVVCYQIICAKRYPGYRWFNQVQYRKVLDSLKNGNVVWQITREVRGLQQKLLKDNDVVMNADGTIPNPAGHLQELFATAAQARRKQ